MALPITNRRSTAAPPPPPEPEPEQTLFDYVILCITTLDPTFPAQGQNEDDQAYLQRICKAIAEMPDDKWGSMDPEGQAWYNEALDALQAGQPVPAPEGFYVEEATPPPPEEPAKAPAPQPSARPQKGVMPPGLARYREEQRNKAQSGNGREPVPAPARAAPAIPPRRTAPTPAPAPAAAPPPRRGMAPPQQAAVPQRRFPAPQAPAPAVKPPRQSVGRDPSIVDDLRTQVIYDPEITPADLIAYARDKGYPQVDSSIGAVVSSVRSIMELLDRFGLIDHNRLEEIRQGG
jgi:hypothetical protein